MYKGNYKNAEIEKLTVISFIESRLELLPKYHVDKKNIAIINLLMLHLKHKPIKRERYYFDFFLEMWELDFLKHTIL